jgi:hypothetical protein
MLDKLSPTTTAAPAREAALPTTTRELRRRLRGQPARIRASAAAKLASGTWPHVPSPAEAARIVETHARLVHRALGRQHKPLTDVEIDRLVERIGPDRLMAALDRLTQPSMFSVAAE